MYASTNLSVSRFNFSHLSHVVNCSFIIHRWIGCVCTEDVISTVWLIWTNCGESVWNVNPRCCRYYYYFDWVNMVKDNRRCAQNSDTKFTSPEIYFDCTRLQFINACGMNMFFLNEREKRAPMHQIVVSLWRMILIMVLIKGEKFLIIIILIVKNTISILYSCIFMKILLSSDRIHKRYNGYQT